MYILYSTIKFSSCQEKFLIFKKINGIIELRKSKTKKEQFPLKKVGGVNNSYDRN